MAMDRAALISRSIGKEKSNGSVRSGNFAFWSFCREDNSTGCWDQKDVSWDQSGGDCGWEDDDSESDMLKRTESGSVGSISRSLERDWSTWSGSSVFIVLIGRKGEQKEKL